MRAVGTVASYDEELGWGVIDADGHPGGCWVHFSAIAGAPPKVLRDGQRVELLSEEADQDGYRYRAVKVWPAGEPEPADPGADADREASAAYGSVLTITFDDADGPRSGD